MILCMCPMCQLNLDGYQGRVNGFFGTDFNLPIIYFTQMLGIAFGIDSKKLGFGKELVTAMPMLKTKLNGQLAATS
jgi:heterodisulfide reductase subunit B